MNRLRRLRAWLRTATVYATMRMCGRMKCTRCGNTLDMQEWLAFDDYCCSCDDTWEI